MAAMNAAKKSSGPNLPKPTGDQATAELEIFAAKARKPRGRHLLRGSAGTGKTTLLQRIVSRMNEETGASIAVTAPTHKAVAVLRRKLQEAGLGVPCLTIHSLLGLEPKPNGTGGLELRRRKHAEPITAKVVIIDEASMVGRDLHEHIERLLFHAFVLYVGDSAQLPPVNEAMSPAFNTASRSVLREIVRQAADNPIIQAATRLRDLQAEDGMSWDWCSPAKNGKHGVFVPGGAVDLWLRRAFTSSDFKKDNDAFRYVAWRNRRVADVNDKVRYWLYGDIKTPFAPGERALTRQPIIRDKQIIFATNEEPLVESIEPGVYQHFVPTRGDTPGWRFALDSWEIKLAKPDGGDPVAVHLPRDHKAVGLAYDRLRSEAQVDRERWEDFFRLKNDLAELQSIYAMTAHTSQGSTHGATFLDVRDIRGREKSDLLECKKLLYVGLTRPMNQAILVGV